MTRSGDLYLNPRTTFTGVALGIAALFAGQATRAEDPAAAATATTEVAAASAATTPTPAPAEPPARIEVLPQEVQLGSPRREMHVLVTGIYADGREVDLTAQASVTSADLQVATADGAILRPVQNGQTKVTVSAAGQSVEVPVTVTGQEVPEPVSFVHGALVALSKQGCNQGACHGSPSGKGGFRLSLRAYDATLDVETLIRESYNRRTNVFDPDDSLLLRKPLMEVAHGGGRKLKKSDAAYALLRDWIAEGLREEPADAATCTKVEVFPRQRVLHDPADSQQMLVLAHFSDGSMRDITRLACYSSSDETVAAVDADGRVTRVDRGETAILVRYLEHMETAYLTFLKPVTGFAWSEPPAANLIDEHVFRKLHSLEILPSDICGDDEFVRRVYLDVIGALPRAEEAQAFLDDTAPDKRARLIDALLARPEYADFWTLRWGDLLRINNKQVSASGVHKFRRWVHAALRDNVPYDQFVRALLVSAGSTCDNPPANYYRAAADMNDCTETTAQLFLGIRIQCAKCHNHPFERWTQDNYYGISAFFNRLQRKPTGAGDEMVVWVARSGEVTQPRTGRQMAPWLPLAGEAPVPAEEDRREAFLAWLVKPDNPFFAAAQVNRLWGYVLGRGIVEPVDDFRASNPPSHPELLAALAQDFVAHGYDQKHVLRTILNSRTYQLSSRTNDYNRADSKYFSHARTRLLSAEQLLDAICQVTGVEEKYSGLPTGTRATQLPSPDVNNYFLKVFGQPAREMACQCERSNESNLSQALQMINGPLVHEKLRAETNKFRQLAAGGKTDDEIVGQLYLAALCRYPSAEELEAARKHIAAQADRIQGLEDVCWALLNAKEFLFQH